MSRWKKLLDRRWNEAIGEYDFKEYLKHAKVDPANVSDEQKEELLRASSFLTHRPIAFIQEMLDMNKEWELTNIEPPKDDHMLWALEPEKVTEDVIEEVADTDLKRAVYYINKINDLSMETRESLMKAYVLSKQNIKRAIALSPNQIDFYEKLMDVQEYLSHIGAIQEDGSSLYMGMHGSDGDLVTEVKNGFDIEAFKQITTFADRVKYAKQNLEYLGQGSSRMAFKFPDKKILKLAKNSKGVAQNATEAEIASDPEFEEIIAAVYEFDREFNWMISEYAPRMKESQFEQIEGYQFRTLGIVLTDVKYGRNIKNDLSPDQYQAFSEGSQTPNFLINSLIQLMDQYDLPVGDLVAKTSYGVSIRDGRPAIVLIDYGLSEEVFDNHYARVRETVLREMREYLSERVLSSMKDSSTVDVKDECKLGGNGDGTSKPCNKGDIKNFKIKDLREDFERKDFEMLSDEQLLRMINEVNKLSFIQPDGKQIRYTTDEELHDFSHYKNALWLNNSKRVEELLDKHNINKVRFRNNLDKLLTVLSKSYLNRSLRFAAESELKEEEVVIPDLMKNWFESTKRRSDVGFIQDKNGDNYIVVSSGFNPEFTVYEFKSGRPNRIGYLFLYKEGEYYVPNAGKADASFIEPEYRNKGIGKALYKFAMSKGFKIKPSTVQSNDAKSLWNSLNKEVELGEADKNLAINAKRSMDGKKDDYNKARNERDAYKDLSSREIEGIPDEKRKEWSNIASNLDDFVNTQPKDYDLYKQYKKYHLKRDEPSFSEDMRIKYDKITDKVNQKYRTVKAELGAKDSNKNWGSGPFDQAMGDTFGDDKSRVFILPHEQEINNQHGTFDVVNGLTLELLYVRPEFRGQGIAKQRLAQLLKVTDKNGLDVYLDVAPQDEITKKEGLIGLYKQFGFTFDGIKGFRKAKKSLGEAEEITPAKYPDLKWIKNELKWSLAKPVRYPILNAFVVGSEAKGSAKPNSDLDIALIINPIKGKTALQYSQEYHNAFDLKNVSKPKWNGREVDFQFFYPTDPELDDYSKIAIEESAHINILGEEREQKIEYGVLMVPFKIANWNEVTGIIKKEDIYDKPTFGLETEPHVTILYGFHDDVDGHAVVDAVKKVHNSPIEIRLVNISIFESEEFDVVKFDVESEDLAKMNEVCAKFPHTTDHPDYHPHMTISYVNKGAGKKYVKDIPSPRKLTSDVLKFADKNKEGFEVKLNDIKEDAYMHATDATKDEYKLGFNENLTFTDKVKDVLDDVTDEKTGEQPYKEFSYSDEVGGSAFGTIVNGVAKITGMQSVPFNKRHGADEDNFKKRGFFKSLLKALYSHGIKSVSISIQSRDTQSAVQRLLTTGKLKNPSNIAGSSGNEHPTSFQISPTINEERGLHEEETVNLPHGYFTTDTVLAKSPDDLFISYLEVHPEYRGGGHFKEIMAGIEKYALEHGKKRIVFDPDITQGKETYDKLVSLYKKYGFVTDLSDPSLLTKKVA